MQIIGSNSIGTGIRADLGTADDIIVLSGSAIGSTNSSAIVGLGSYHRAEIYGSAVASLCAIQLGDNLASDYGNKVLIHPGAFVYSFYFGISVGSSGSTVVNEGTIDAYYGMQAGGTGPNSMTTITNTGVLTSDATGILRAYGSTEKLVITNSGLIEGSFSISGNGMTAVEEITNTGTIRGTIYLFGGDDLYNGTAGRLSGGISAGDGNDRLYGGIDNDLFYGDAGADMLKGNAGNDTLNGGAGADRMEGGTGNDTFYVDDDHDVVVELSGQGTDTVQAAGNYTLGANVENLILLYKTDAIGGTGNSLANTIAGNTANNTLKGLSGNDKLSGDLGADKLYGGTGTDQFIFKSVTDSTVASSGRDTIYDFSHAQKDRIVLSSIDSDTKASGNQAFTFIGKSAFSHDAGELRYKFSGSSTIVEGDVNGDGKADFAILLSTKIDLVKGDFIL
ncbi:hypothetical protein J5J10_12825 [Ciceribacter sp. L1K23]|uniref:calcium-binding protein n=1 Tax=Ciceribacter sp. L1K23 TaxID=2820276 RepID=UPI001B82B48C|nr:hypothetical protein [Ciceribacter sp. L1K23]MBR0556564.1 hypothetical protein [Ciceribacter sp. L1K23]